MKKAYNVFRICYSGLRFCKFVITKSLRSAFGFKKKSGETQFEKLHSTYSERQIAKEVLLSQKDRINQPKQSLYQLIVQKQYPDFF